MVEKNLQEIISQIKLGDLIQITHAHKNSNVHFVNIGYVSNIVKYDESGEGGISIDLGAELKYNSMTPDPITIIDRTILTFFGEYNHEIKNIQILKRYKTIEDELKKV